MALDYLGLIRFGVDAGCPCSSPEDLVIVRAYKVHQGWSGFSSQVEDEFDFRCYLTLTPGTGFSGESPRVIDPLSGLSSGTILTADPGYASDSDSHFFSFHGYYDQVDAPYERFFGEIALSSEYTLGDVQEDVDEMLAESGAHPAGFASDTYNLARRRELAFSSYGMFPSYSGTQGTYTEARFSGSSPLTWWGDSGVDGTMDFDVDARDPEGSRLISGRYFLVTEWKRMGWYFRERAFIPATGYYSSQTIVQVDHGLGWVTLEDTGKAYYYHSGAFIDVRSPHLPGGYADEGDQGFGGSVAVRVIFWIDPSDTPPEGTSYTESSTAGQSEGC